MTTVRSIGLAALCAVAACTAEPETQVITGRVDASKGALAIRAIADDDVVTAAAVRTDGSFTLALPAGKRYRLEVLTRSGRKNIVTRSGSVLRDVAFAVCQPVDPFDCGDVGDPPPGCMDPSDPNCTQPPPSCDPMQDPDCKCLPDGTCCSAMDPSCPPPPPCMDPSDPNCQPPPPGCDPMTDPDCNCQADGTCCDPMDPTCGQPPPPCMDPRDPNCGCQPGDPSCCDPMTDPYCKGTCTDPMDPTCGCAADGTCPPPPCTDPMDPTCGCSADGTCPPPPCTDPMDPGCVPPCDNPMDPTTCKDPCLEDPMACGCPMDDPSCWPAPQPCDGTSGEMCDPGDGMTPDNMPTDFGCKDGM